MVNVQKYQWVAIGDTIRECEKNYSELLNTNGIVSQNKDALKQISGKITAIAPVVLEGTTHYYLCMEGSEDIYDVDMSEEALIGIIRYGEGDRISVSYTEGYGLHEVEEIGN